LTSQSDPLQKSFLKVQEIFYGLIEKFFPKLKTEETRYY